MDEEELNRMTEQRLTEDALKRLSFFRSPEIEQETFEAQGSETPREQGNETHTQKLRQEQHKPEAAKPGRQEASEHEEQEELRVSVETETQLQKDRHNGKNAGSGAPVADTDTETDPETTTAPATATQQPQIPPHKSSDESNFDPSFVSLTHQFDNSKSSSEQNYINYIEDSELVPSKPNSVTTDHSDQYNKIDLGHGKEPVRPLHLHQKKRRSFVDPNSVSIFSNQEALRAVKEPGKDQDQDQDQDLEMLPEGIGRPLYVPAVIRRTEEKIDPLEFYHAKEKQRHAAEGIAIARASSTHSSSNSFGGNSPTNVSNVSNGFGLSGDHSNNGSVSDSRPDSLRSVSYDSKDSFKSKSLNGLKKKLFGHSSPLSADLFDKSHWKADNSTNHCHGCGQEFNVLYARKHHCRKCGEIFCEKCIDHVIKLSYDLQFKMLDSKQISLANDEFQAEDVGNECKSCEECYKKYKKFVNDRLSLLVADGDEEEEETQAKADHDWSTF